MGQPWASGRHLLFPRSRDIAPPERATPPTNRLIQCLRASCLPRAFAAFDPGHGSCGGALAQGFGESATLAMTIQQAMNRSRPVRSNRPWPPMDHDAAPRDDEVAF